VNYFFVYINEVKIMKKIIIAILTITLLFAVGCTSTKVPQKGTEINQTPKQSENTDVGQGDAGGQSSTSDESQEKAGITKVKVFLIAMGIMERAERRLGERIVLFPLR
jgi:hypothetical protein